MVYQSHLMSLSPQDVKKLGRGMILTIRQGQMGHGVPVFLNGLQAAQMKRGGNIRLRMNRSQFRHNLRHGGGIWDTFKEHALPQIIKFGTEQLKKHGPAIGHKILDKLETHKKLQGKASQGVLGLARKGLNHFTDKKPAVAAVPAAPSKPPPVPKRPYGPPLPPRPVKKSPPPIPPRPTKRGGAPFGTMGASVTYRRGGAPVGTMGASVTSRRIRGGSFRLAGSGSKRKYGGSFMLA